MIRPVKIFALPFFLFFLKTLTAQQYEDFGFQRDTTVVVHDSLGNVLKNPWGGGLNSCHFSEIDLDFDGIKDLFVFDRSSSKIMTFINNGTADSIDYVYAPEYRKKFPQIHDWAELVDYNGDGKEDIFTFSYGSAIAVYKNVGDAVNGLKFELVTGTILTFENLIYVNLLVTQVDYPAIADIDNDGDLDILSFFGMGEYLEYHRNMSMELYGIPDSLKYVREDHCWGEFMENAYGNSITLNIVCPPSKDEENNFNISTSDIKHTGSTLLALDLDGDTLKDLLIGDVDFPDLFALYNKGTLSDALITSTDTLFPSNTQQIDLVSFPVPSYLDVNNDGKKDLIVSPFDAGPAIAENQKSCWYYKNTNTASSPVFDYQYDNFLQKDMIDLGSGAYPVLHDYDGDGLKDLFVSNFGKRDSSYYSSGYLYSVYVSGISLYKNTGTASNPEFTFITNDFADIRARKLTGIYPAFGDIDDDGAAEMIIGKSNGKLDLYENLAPAGQPMDMVLSQINYDSIYVGSTPTQTYPSATPQLFDLDKDSLPDLIIGRKAGTLYYYKNTGTAQIPQFTMMNDSLGMVDVVKHTSSNYGFSVPCFFTDSTGETKLFVGSESGYIYYYKNIDGNLTGSFTLEDSLLLYLNDGMRGSVAVANLDSDNFPEMITGNYSGGVTCFKGITPPPVGIDEYQIIHNSLEIFPNPASNTVSIKIPVTLSGKISIEIYDYKGSEISRNYFNSFRQIYTADLSGYRNGLYFISIHDDDARIFYIGKVIVLN